MWMVIMVITTRRKTLMRKVRIRKVVVMVMLRRKTIIIRLKIKT